jgi:hypothetical protein
MENMSSYGTQIYRLKRPWTNILVLGNKNLDTKEQNIIDPKDIMRTQKHGTNKLVYGKIFFDKDELWTAEKIHVHAKHK